MRFRPGQIGLGLVGLGLGALGVVELREATLSEHERIPRDTRVALVVDARTRGGETNQTLQEMVEAVLVGCRLEVASDLVGEVADEGDGRFRAVLQPALDETNRRQLRGCIEDWTIDQVLVDVVGFVQTS